MSARNFDFALAIGGAAGQGIATPGSILARLFVRRGLHLYAYNAYQSIIRGGHIFLTIRISDQPIGDHGDKLDLLLALNQDTMNRHLGLLGPGARAIYNGDTITPGDAAEGVQLCGLPIAELTNNNRNKLVQNTVALGAVMSLFGLDFQILEDALTLMFQRKGQAVVDENVSVARAGFDYTAENFAPFPRSAAQKPQTPGRLDGQRGARHGGRGRRSQVLLRLSDEPRHGRPSLDVKECPRAGYHGAPSRRRNRGGQHGHWSRSHRVPHHVCYLRRRIRPHDRGCRRGRDDGNPPWSLSTCSEPGPSTGVPTKTEQGDLWQILGASQGDFQRFIVAPLDAVDAFNSVPEIFNLCDKRQCPGIVLSDLLISEGTFSFDPDEVNMQPKIDRGELITEPSQTDGYKRYLDTESGVSPRAVPGLEGYVHVVATDEHDEDGILISDEFTNPHKRREAVEKRARKMEGIVNEIAPPRDRRPRRCRRHFDRLRVNAWCDPGGRRAVT